MKNVQVAELAIPDVKVVRYGHFADDRGYFTEGFRASDLNAINVGPVVQQNESYSKANTVRGLHFQWSPFMGKLVRTLSGHMVDIVLDIRRGSPTLGKALLYDMPQKEKGEDGQWIWVPPGFAHGNFFIKPSTIEYLCTGEYSNGSEAGISPLSPDIDWSLADPKLKASFDSIISESSNLVISEKDRVSFSMQDWLSDERSYNFIYGAH